MKAKRWWVCREVAVRLCKPLYEPLAMPLGDELAYERFRLLSLPGGFTARTTGKVRNGHQVCQATLSECPLVIEVEVDYERDDNVGSLLHHIHTRHEWDLHPEVLQFGFGLRLPGSRGVGKRNRTNRFS